MDNLFEKLFKESESPRSLDRFLSENMQHINEFYNSNYVTILASRESIERFILLKSNTIKELDYSNSYTKSFSLMLLEFCERLNLISSTPRIYSILNENRIQINSRLEAGLEFLYPKPKTCSELIGRFDNICKKLQIAIDVEEDNDKKSIVTFLNYYGIIVNDTSSEYVKQIKQKISVAIDRLEYSFLQNQDIRDIINLNISDLSTTYIRIQEKIDRILGIENNISYIPEEKTEVNKDILIEIDTEYSKKLSLVTISFNAIRKISVQYASSQKITGRGVKILESENELFGYFKSFGNMHRAKLLSAFRVFTNVPTKINIIDWGCGQGFASMVFLEQFGSENINQITLIEPSNIAIKRAALHCRKYNQNISLRTICKTLDNLGLEDFKQFDSDTTIHLFSNILDIDDYKQSQLVHLIDKLGSGKKYFFCVSPYIDEIKTERLESFDRYFKRKYNSYNSLLDVKNTKAYNNEFWNCNNYYKEGNINHGAHLNCNDYTECGCYNKWTRVIKVFSI